MTLEVRRFLDQTEVAWRNGGGVTRELACAPSAPSASSTETFDWRVSIAGITAAGSFSAFPGIDRVILLCDGPTMVLDVGGNREVLGHRVPFAFPGDSLTRCQVPDGPTRALNVMTRRGRCAADVRVLNGHGAALEIAEGEPTIAVVLAARSFVSLLGQSEALRMNVFDAVLVSQACTIRTIGESELAVIRIESGPDDGEGGPG